MGGYGNRRSQGWRDQGQNQGHWDEFHRCLFPQRNLQDSYIALHTRFVYHFILYLESVSPIVCYVSPICQGHELDKNSSICQNMFRSILQLCFFSISIRIDLDSKHFFSLHAFGAGAMSSLFDELIMWHFIIGSLVYHYMHPIIPYMNTCQVYSRLGFEN